MIILNDVSLDDMTIELLEGLLHLDPYKVHYSGNIHSDLFLEEVYSKWSFR